MKNIKAFENYNVQNMNSESPIKNYGEYFPISDLSEGDVVVYLGGKYTVIESDGYVLLLKSLEGGDKVRVNQNMFNARGYIRNGETPIKLR